MHKLSNIVENKFLYFGISLAIIFAGIISCFVQGFNWDIDFTGGTTIQIDLGKEFDNNELAKFVEQEVGKPPQVSKNQKEITQAIIKTIPLESEEREELYNKLAEKYEIQDIRKAVISSDNFSATVGKELTINTIKAASITIIAILLYITLRFELNVAISGILALFHDALVMFSIYTIFQIPMNTNFVAVLLTILGYSINDTVVIFDRIRTNVKNSKKENYAEIANRSIWEMMGRSINTSATTLISILLLLVFGVPSIKEFAIPLAVGIIAGAYSSIFLAVPISVMLPHRFHKAKANRR